MDQALPAAATTRFGPKLLGNGEALFRFYAPDCAAVDIELRGTARVPLTPRQDGWFEVALQCEPGVPYSFVLPDGTRVPDPASRVQSSDIDGASVLTDPDSYAWKENQWRGRPWHEMVFYELHVGLFGGFKGVAERLPELASYGITAIELMPVADFEGRHNWGYDGVLLFAPDRAYGTPDDLKALIDCAHALNVSVFLDVVYNHFGPSGNYLSNYARPFFRDDLHTPWGAALDYRRPEVRDFYTENALHWLSEYRFDGLRFDAIHTIEDAGWLSELPARLRAALPDREVHLVLENDHNDAAMLEKGFNAQWNDDIHHSLHVLITGEREAYYVDYAESPAQQLARTLSEGFAYQGEPSQHRDGAPRGTPSGHLSPQSFIAFLQNHDQIGNRARGERLNQLTTPAQLAAALSLLLLSPQIPMLFMGEEINSTAPFYFFSDYTGELAEAVRTGRRAEFARFSAFVDLADLVPDPNALMTFETSRVKWPAIGEQDAATLRYTDLLRSLLMLRHRVLMPRLAGSRGVMAEAVSDSAVFAEWRLGDGSHLCIYSNLGMSEAIVDWVVPADASILMESAVGASRSAKEGRLAPASTLAWLHHQDSQPSRRRYR
jgi:maltooligosyltrehalose trehalohydrolase